MSKTSEDIFLYTFQCRAVIFLAFAAMSFVFVVANLITGNTTTNHCALDFEDGTTKFDVDCRIESGFVHCKEGNYTQVKYFKCWRSND